MNLQMIFRVNGAVSLLNGVSFLFLTEIFLGMAGFTMTPQLMTLGQAMGTSLIAIGLFFFDINVFINVPSLSKKTAFLYLTT